MSLFPKGAVLVNFSSSFLPVGQRLIDHCVLICRVRIMLTVNAYSICESMGEHDRIVEKSILKMSTRQPHLTVSALPFLDLFKIQYEKFNGTSLTTRHLAHILPCFLRRFCRVSHPLCNPGSPVFPMKLCRNFSSFVFEEEAYDIYFLGFYASRALDGIFVSCLQASCLCVDAGGYLPVLRSRAELHHAIALIKTQCTDQFSQAIFLGVDPWVSTKKIS